MIGTQPYSVLVFYDPGLPRRFEQGFDANYLSLRRKNEEILIQKEPNLEFYSHDTIDIYRRLHGKDMGFQKIKVIEHSSKMKAAQARYIKGLKKQGYRET